LKFLQRGFLNWELSRGFVLFLDTQSKTDGIKSLILIGRHN
jgi:hypothetical protein